MSDATSARTEGHQVRADRKLEAGDQGLGEGMRSRCFLGTERQFGEMGSSGDGRRCWSYNSVRVRNAPGL